MAKSGTEPAGGGPGLTGGVLAAFACVYFFWGSTYAAIRIAGEYLAPPLVGACRTALTTVFMVALCLMTGRSLRVERREAWRLALVGVLFMTVNNILLTWAETMVASGLASLLVATTPMMVAVMEAMLPGGEALNRRGWSGLLLGTVGMAALLSPSLRRTAPEGGRHLLAYGVLLAAAFAFALGSVLGRRFHFKADTFVATTWQIGAAGVCNALLALAAGSWRTAHWTRPAVGAVIYLAVFGSLVGLSCLTYLLKHVPVTKVATYAFVNPVVAVLLGVALLHERLHGAELAGMLVIVLAVALVIFSRVGRQPGPGPTLEDVTAEGSWGEPSDG